MTLKCFLCGTMIPRGSTFYIVSAREQAVDQTQVVCRECGKFSADSKSMRVLEDITSEAARVPAP